MKKTKWKTQSNHKMCEILARTTYRIEVQPYGWLRLWFDFLVMQLQRSAVIKQHIEPIYCVMYLAHAYEHGSSQQQRYFGAKKTYFKTLKHKLYKATQQCGSLNPPESNADGKLAWIRSCGTFQQLG